MDLFCLITLFSFIYNFNESTRFINGLIKCALFEYLIILFMLRSTCALKIISQYIPTHSYEFNLKQYYLPIPLYKYISCMTISVFEISYNLNVEQFIIFHNVSYNITFVLSVLENVPITAIPIIFSYIFTYIVFSLHIICYLGLACVLQYTHTSELLMSGLIHILSTISVMFLKHENNFRDMKRLINVLHTCIFYAIHCYLYTVIIWKQSIINFTRMSQFINIPIQSMDSCNVLLHCTTIKYYIILSYRIYYHILPDIYNAFAPSKYILLFKFVWILINVRKIVFFCIFICVHISLFYSLVYILISACLGVSLSQSDIERRHAHYTISRVNRTHGKSSLHSNNFQYGSVTRNINCTLRTPHNFLTMNQVVSYDWYAFVSSKPLFTFANIQYKFTCFIYITSAGNFFKFLIAFFPYN